MIDAVAEVVLDMRKKTGIRVDVVSKTCHAREGNIPPPQKVCDRKSWMFQRISNRNVAYAKILGSRS